MKKIKEGYFFNVEKSQQSEWGKYDSAMQVMECWEEVMTVKCKDGCLTKPYSFFEKINDLSGFKKVYTSTYFEDNRIK